MHCNTPLRSRRKTLVKERFVAFGSGKRLNVFPRAFYDKKPT